MLARRRLWFEGQAGLAPERLIFIDQTGASMKMARLRGWSRKGERCRASNHGGGQLPEPVGQRYERGAIVITSNLPFDEWTEIFGSERLTVALLDRLTHHVHILEMNGDSYRLNQSRRKQQTAGRS